MGSVFYALFRKRGFSDTLEILNEFQKKRATEAEFFKILKECSIYSRDYYRVRSKLIEYGMITYALNKSLDKIICLTLKGQEFVRMLEDIDLLLKDNNYSKLETNTKKQPNAERIVIN